MRILPSPRRLWINLRNTLHPPPPRLPTDHGSSETLLPPEKPWVLRRPTTINLPRLLKLPIILCILCIAFAIYYTVHMAPRKFANLKATNDALQSQSWGTFPVLEAYYRGLTTLVPASQNIPDYPPGAAKPDKPPQFGTVDTKPHVYDPYPPDAGIVKCGFGDARRAPNVRVYHGVPMGMPQAVLGSAEVLGLNQSVCFDRVGRFGDYGIGYPVESGGLGLREETFIERPIDWRGVDWAVLQKQCLKANAHRFAPEPAREDSLFPRGEEGKKRPRTAVVLRTWWDYEYKPDDIANIRALISELAIHSGGEYAVHILVHVRDTDRPIYASKSVYAEVLATSTLPKEFHGLAELWNESMMQTLYSAVPDDYIANPTPEEHFRRLPHHGVYRSTFMPVQWFAQRHPQYDFFWHWEMDIRYTGHFYHLFDRLHTWSSAPQHHDNLRFYIPTLHGPWSSFSTPSSSSSSAGPAHLITLNPQFNAQNSSWILRDDSSGFPPATPHRSAIITASRLSRELLAEMHKHAVEGATMFSEMLPPSVAALHALKAVYAPHPVYFERAWPRAQIAAVFGGVDGQVWGDREDRFAGASWFYNAHWAGTVFRRWLGIEGVQEGRMCLPGGWLLHPVK